MADPSPWSVIQGIAERRILEAQERGDFDDLPGSGRPLNLEDDSAVPEELRMAYKILRNSGCLPPELADRKEINGLLDMLERCVDERERVRHMERLRYLVTRARTRHQRPFHLEEDDPYYDRILDRLSGMEKAAASGGKA